MISGNIQGRGVVGGNIGGRRGVNGNITNGSGGGSTVSITPVLESGVKIADYEIDGESGELFAPSPLVYNLIKTKLYDSNSLLYGAPMNTEIALNDSLSNYDIGVLLWNTTQDRSRAGDAGTDFVFFIPSIVISNDPTNNAYRLHFAGYERRWGVVTLKNNSFIFDNRGGDLLPEIYQIWGIKLGAIV